MSKHTPGPWNYRYGGMSVYPEANADVDIARVYQYRPMSAEENEANARLIAAAPELLEALEEFVHHVEFQWHPDVATLKQAIAAIKKAKGET